MPEPAARGAGLRPAQRRSGRGGLRRRTARGAWGCRWDSYLPSL